MIGRRYSSGAGPASVFRSVCGARRNAAALALAGLAIPTFVLAARTEAVPVRPGPIYDGLAESMAAAAPPIGRCEVTAASSHAPTNLRVGDTVGVTLTLQSECGDTPVNLVLVIDASGSGQATENVLVWAEDIVEFALEQMPLARVGVVAYNDVATVQCDLSNDADALRTCIANVVTGGGRRLDLGITEAAAMFRRHAPDDPALEPYHADIAVLLVAGPPDPDCSASIAASSELKGQGVLVWSVQPCTDCDVHCARRVATSPRYLMTNWDVFLGLFDQVTRPLYPYRTVVSTTLPASMTLSTVYHPPPREDGPILEWAFATPVPNPMTVTYRAYAHEAGTYDLGPTRARLDFRGLGYQRPHYVAFEPAIVHVTGSIWLPLLVQGR